MVGHELPKTSPQWWPIRRWSFASTKLDAGWSVDVGWCRFNVWEIASVDQPLANGISIIIVVLTDTWWTNDDRWLDISRMMSDNGGPLQRLVIINHYRWSTSLLTCWSGHKHKLGCQFWQLRLPNISYLDTIGCHSSCVAYTSSRGRLVCLE